MTGFQSLEEFVECVPVTSRTATTVVDATDTPVYPFGVVSGWERPVSGEYPKLALIDGTTLSVPAGTGYIVNADGDVIKVSWDAREVAVPTMQDTWVATVAVDSTGLVRYFAGTSSPSAARSHIVLGTLTFIGGTASVDASSASARTSPCVWQSGPYTAHDLAYAHNGTTISGGLVSASRTAPLGLRVAARTEFGVGVNADDEDSPNTVTIPADARISFHAVTGSGDYHGKLRDVPTTRYNPAGGTGVGDLSNVPGTATVHRLFRLVDDYVLVFGQTAHVSLSAAVAAITDEPFVVPMQLAEAELLAYVAVVVNAESLSNTAQAKVIAANQAGGSTAGGDGVSEPFELLPDPGFLQGTAGLRQEITYGSGTSLVAGSDYRIVDLDQLFGYGKHPLPSGTKALQIMRRPGMHALMHDVRLSDDRFEVQGVANVPPVLTQEYWAYNSRNDDTAMSVGLLSLRYPDQNWSAYGFSNPVYTGWNRFGTMQGVAELGYVAEYGTELGYAVNCAGEGSDTDYVLIACPSIRHGSMVDSGFAERIEALEDASAGGATINDIAPSTSMCYSSAKVEGLRRFAATAMNNVEENYTLTADDVGAYVRVNAYGFGSASQITIPSSWGVICPTLGVVTIRNAGSTDVTLAAPSGSSSSYTIAAGVTVQVVVVDSMYVDVIGPDGVTMEIYSS
jgi:hypothetical protein